MSEQVAEAGGIRVLAERPNVVSLVIDNPPVNAVNPDIIDALLEAIDGLAGDDVVRAVVLRGANGRFCAGADLSVMASFERSTYRAMRRWIDVQNALERLEKPVICAIERFALGGGAEVALACDRRIIGAESVFGFPEAAVGLFPGAGGTQRLPRLVGVSQAFWLMATGAKLKGQEALEAGLVDEVVPDDEVVERALDAAHTLAQGPTRAIGLMKRCVYEGWGRELLEGLEREADAVYEVIKTADVREGVKAFFDRRPAEFEGR